jgi:predicted nuclease of predicted toxin-antitoxin system
MSLPLLLNENFPAPSVAILREEGFDLVFIADSQPGIDDVDVLALAVREGRCVVTFDGDYGELLFARRYPAPPALILLRISSYRPEEPAQWVMRLVANEKECLGRFTVVDDSAIRSRPLHYEIGNEQTTP